MPIKAKQSSGTSKKTEVKKKEKIIEDKTFGLKNKKGAKQQKFIQRIEKQVKNSIVPSLDKKAEKEKKLKDQKELNSIFKPVQTQKVEKGVDPKSILCAFFKQGQCTKGDKCKFSHDLTIERKSEKRSLYVDERDMDKDDMSNWDNDKLQEVIEKKHGQSDKIRPTTDIICKYFLEAVEKSKYGWFWECPSGTKCIYRHALPPGFVLKKDQKKDDKRNEISIEDLIERERASLGSNQTKITLKTFLDWKRRKIQEHKNAIIKEEEKKRIDFKAGRHIGLSGREMFSFNPDLADDNEMYDGDEAIISYAASDDNEDNTHYKEIDFSQMYNEAQEVDNTGTVVKDRTFEINDDVPINENLFLADDEDLTYLDKELNDLEVS